MKIEKQFFTLNDLTKKWQISEDEILMLFHERRILLSAIMFGYLVEGRRTLEDALDQVNVTKESRLKTERLFLGDNLISERKKIDIAPDPTTFEISIPRVYTLHFLSSRGSSVKIPHPSMFTDGTKLKYTSVNIDQNDHACIDRRDIFFPAECINSLEDLLSDQIKRSVTPSPRAKKTYLHIIGGLLDIIKGEYGNELPMKSNAAIINVLLEKLDGFEGISKRTLETRFSEANKLLT